MSSVAKLWICSKSRTLIFRVRVCRASAGVSVALLCVAAGCRLSGGGSVFAAKGGLGGRGVGSATDWWLEGARGACGAVGACCVEVPVEPDAHWLEADIGVSDREGVWFRLGLGLECCGAGGGGGASW